MSAKAYEVGVDWVEVAEIVFAEKPSKAKAKAIANFSGNYEWTEMYCRRAPAFDDLNGKSPTVQDYLDRDWFFNCANCGQQTSLHDEPPTIVVYDNWPCCTEECAEIVRADPLFDGQPTEEAK